MLKDISTVADKITTIFVPFVASISEHLSCLNLSFELHSQLILNCLWRSDVCLSQTGLAEIRTIGKSETNNLTDAIVKLLKTMT